MPGEQGWAFRQNRGETFFHHAPTFSGHLICQPIRLVCGLRCWLKDKVLWGGVTRPLQPQSTSSEQGCSSWNLCSQDKTGEAGGPAWSCMGGEAYGPVPLRTGPQGCVLSFFTDSTINYGELLLCKGQIWQRPAFKLLQSSRSDKTCICPKMPRHESYPELSVAFMRVTKDQRRERWLVGSGRRGLLTQCSPWVSQCSQCFACSHSFNPHNCAAILQKRKQAGRGWWLSQGPKTGKWIWSGWVVLLTPRLFCLLLPCPHVSLPNCQHAVIEMSTNVFTAALIFSVKKKKSLYLQACSYVLLLDYKLQRISFSYTYWVSAKSQTLL